MGDNPVEEEICEKYVLTLDISPLRLDLLKYSQN